MPVGSVSPPIMTIVIFSMQTILGHAQPRASSLSGLISIPLNYDNTFRNKKGRVSTKIARALTVAPSKQNRTRKGVRGGVACNHLHQYEKANTTTKPARCAGAIERKVYLSGCTSLRRLPGWPSRCRRRSSGGLSRLSPHEVSRSALAINARIQKEANGIQGAGRRGGRGWASQFFNTSYELNL